ncbi:MAG: AI-2E family transporter [Verrucomicrobiota bacterium]
MSDYPTPWQRKTMWAALSAFFVVFIVVMACAVIWAVANVMGFLQPILIPVAIAAILAYLLDPLVTRIADRGLGRTRAIVLMFLAAFVALVGMAWWLGPTISVQSSSFAKELPNYTQSTRDYVVDLLVKYNRTFAPPASGHEKPASPTTGIVRWLLGAQTRPSPTPASPPELKAHPEEAIGPTPAKTSFAERQHIQAYVEKQIPNLERYLPTLAEKFWTLIKTSIGGFLGVTGFLLSLVLVPIYLFFLLKESPRIAQRWKEYLPLRASPFKDEVADALSQINYYIIAYFRGQLLVCMVDGILIGSALTLIGLNFAPLIGIMVAVLTMIPYIGIIICWVPAVLISAFQFGGWWPLWVTVIFVVIQNLEGMFYAPRIVGNSVGLHPMTVIVSIFVWGLLIGGLLGPILAVPLTATLKVILTRYVWGRRLRSEMKDVVAQVPVVQHSNRVAT